MIFTLPPCWGVDTNAKLTAAQAKALADAQVNGQPIKFVFRYVSLGAPSPADITVAERDAILASGLALGLVQHVNYPGWVASQENGAAHGAAAAAHATLVGYAPNAMLAVDMEGVKDVGQPVIDYVTAWAKAVHAAGFRVLLYVGYCCGISPQQLAALRSAGVVDAFWADYGPRAEPPGFGFIVKQHAQTTIAGICVDPDECFGHDDSNQWIGLMAADAAPTIAPEDVFPHVDLTEVRR